MPFLPRPIIVLVSALAACTSASTGTSELPPGSSGAPASDEASTGTDTSTRPTTNEGDTTGTSNSATASHGAESGGVTETGDGPTGPGDPPTLDAGAHFRGLLTLSDGTVLQLDALPETSVNPVNGNNYCSVDAVIGEHEVDVDLSWPDTATLLRGHHPWALTSDRGPQIRIGIDGPLGNEQSLSTVGFVHFVDVGTDTPPSVSGFAEVDLDPAGDGDLLQSMVDIEFRCLL